MRFGNYDKSYMLTSIYLQNLKTIKLYNKIKTVT